MRKNSRILLGALLAGAACSMATPRNAIAAEGDMVVGTWGSMFCGAPATFEVQSKKGGEWVFEGKILIRDTGEYDRISIKQYDDNSLRIMPYLSGANTGKKQWARTRPPKFKSANGRPAAWFSTTKGNGVGCNNSGAVTVLVVAY